MSIETLTARLNKYDSDVGSFAIEDFVLSKPFIRDGETHADCMHRLHPEKKEPAFFNELITATKKGTSKTRNHGVIRMI